MCKGFAPLTIQFNAPRNAMRKLAKITARRVAKMNQFIKTDCNERIGMYFQSAATSPNRRLLTQVVLLNTRTGLTRPRNFPATIPAEQRLPVMAEDLS